MKSIHSLRASLLILLMLAPIQAWSEVGTVSSGARNRNVSLAGAGHASITWVVTGTFPNPGPHALSSLSGTLTTPTGTLLLTRSKQLRKPFTTTVAAQPYTFVFQEMLTIPRSVLIRARQQGSARMVYSRTFSDQDGAPGTSKVLLTITGALAGPLDLSRLELRFDDDSTIRIAGTGDSLKAHANLNFSGTGLLNAVWEVAQPGSTRGRAFFIPLRNLRQYLSAGGHVVLQSPPLPTQNTGVYRVRLRIVQPAAAFELPELSYHVQETQTPATPRARPALRVMAPEEGDTLTPSTAFRWEPVVGASAYQLEIYEQPLPEPVASDVTLSEDAENRPLTGVLVPGSDHMTLSPLVLSHLTAGMTYHWRVLALGAGGHVLAVSATRPIQLPAAAGPGDMGTGPPSQPRAEPEAAP